MKISVRLKGIFCAFALLIYAFSITTALAHDSGSSPWGKKCEQWLTSKQTLEDAFSDEDFGVRVLSFLDRVTSQVHQAEMTNPAELSRWASTPEGRARLKIASFAREKVFPLLNRHSENASFLSHPELSELAREEQAQILGDLADVRDTLYSSLSDLLIPHGDTDSAIIEIVRGHNLSLSTTWIRMLARMYLTAAPKMKWSAELISLDEEADGSGYRRAVIRIKGPQAYQFLQFEHGLHRRIHIGTGHAASSRNRTHTLYADVMVYPEPKTVDAALKPQDVEVETMRASGAGGQHVNRTDSAVRVRHIPTGLEVSIQSHRSQHQNRAEAFRILAAKVLRLAQSQEQERLSAARKTRPVETEDSRYVRTYDERYNPVPMESLLVYGELEPYLKARLLQVLKTKLNEVE